MVSNKGISAWRRLRVRLGWSFPEGGESRSGTSRSRYGRGYSVSARLDEDLDDLRHRVEALERLASRGDGH